MCSQHRPEMGADSIDPAQLSIADLTLAKRMEVERPFRVLVRDYDGGRHSITVRAIGPRGAEGTAMQTARDRGIDAVGVLNVEAA